MRARGARLVPHALCVPVAAAAGAVLSSDARRSKTFQLYRAVQTASFYNQISKRCFLLVLLTISLRSPGCRRILLSYFKATCEGSILRHPGRECAFVPLDQAEQII